MAKNPYTLLGVKKTASEADIRKAYRNLAKKLHPDVNPGDKKAEERFKEATAAYNLLSDKDLRARYDSGQVDASGQQQHPFSGAGAGNPFGNASQQGFHRNHNAYQGRAGSQDDMAQLFSSLFGMNMGQMQGGMQPRPAKGGDIIYKLTVSLPEALRGLTQSLDQGLKVKVPKGVKDGQTLRLRGKGQPGQYGGAPGDAKVEITIHPHKYLSRKGDNLLLNLPISLYEAINGAKITLDMPSGAVALNLPAGMNTGKKLKLKGKGVNKGDLIVAPMIMLTESERAQSEALRQILPKNDAETLRRGII